MPQRAAIYARVSSDEQSKNFSLPGQVVACRALAANEDLFVVAEYQEDYTGTTLDRPEFNQMRALIDKKAIDLVIVYDIDRLARGLMLQLIVEHEFKLAGVEIHYVHGGSFEDSPEGQLQKNILGSFAEYERAKILRRMADGKKRRAAEGHVAVSKCAPYGYDYISEPHHGRFEINDDEADVVRTIFRWYVFGDETGKRLGTKQIARRLSELRVPTKSDSGGHEWRRSKATGVWSSSTVIRMLANETYAGVWYFGKWSRVSATQVEARPRTEWISVEVPAIVDRDTFDRARELATENRVTAKRNVKHDYLLRGRLRCDRCGRRMRGFDHGGGKEKRGPYYYRCPGMDATYAADAQTTTCHWSVRSEAVDAKVWEKLKALLENPDELVERIRQQQQRVKSKSVTIEERIAQLDREISDLDDEEARLAYAYRRRSSSSKVFEAQLDDIDAQRTARDKERSELRKSLASVVLSDAQISAIETKCRQARKGIEHATFEQKRHVVEVLNISGLLIRGDGPGTDRLQLTGWLQVGDVPLAEGDSGAIATTTSKQCVSNHTEVSFVLFVDDLSAKCA